MLHVRTVRPGELNDGQLTAWSALQQADPELRSPYFHPGFTQAVAAVRNDVYVAVLEQQGEPVGFFPFQRRPFSVGQPVGGRLSDFHGAVVRPGVAWNADDLLRGCGLSAWRFDHLPASQQPFAARAWNTEISPWVDLSQGYAAYEADKRASSSHELKQTHRKSRKLEREVGPLRFEPRTTDRRVFETLLRWKSAQYQRTGLADVFAFGWTVALLERLWDRQDQEPCGVLSALYAGERLAAMHFGMQAQGVLHYWFPAYDVELSPYSPGMILLVELARAAEQMGVRRIDLGKGRNQYKLTFMTDAIPVAEGVVERRGMRRLVRTGWRKAREWVRSSPLRGPAETPLRWIRPVREWLTFR